MATRDERATVTFLNPRTCGIYKNGSPRFKTDPITGRRTNEIDNELIDFVEAYLRGETTPGQATIPSDEVWEKDVLVPTYYDHRYNDLIYSLLQDQGIDGVTIGELEENGTILVRGGHGSPGNDQRTGSVPYIKVSDIRALRVNVNPTNLVPESIARRLWRGNDSGLRAWDLVTPNRASSNIGEFAVLLPGQEQIVMTKEVFILRVLDDRIIDPFYLLWALSLQAVRDQWRRIALMQTNREDCGDRYREIIIPNPPSREWARRVSRPFRDYFTSIAQARETFDAAVSEDGFDYVASVHSYELDEADTEVDEEAAE